jgi:hypothetical protein
MGKHKKPKKRKKSISSGNRQQILNREQISIRGEAEYIIKCAQNYDSRVVSLGPLVFFSTETGDAWILDPEDRLALCLSRDGEKQDFTINESPTNFSIEWKANYRIEEDKFIVYSQSGEVRTIIGYPTKAILNIINRMG